MAGLVIDTYLAILVTISCASVAVVLRVIARRIAKFELWWDDYFCFVAFFFACGYSTAVMTWTIHYRFGQSVLGFDPEYTEHLLERSRLIMWIHELMYASSLAFSKLAILSFYWRVFQFTSIRIPILLMLAASGAWLMIRTFMVIFQCNPVRYMWDKNIPGGGCNLNLTKFFFGTILTHCTMDVIILVLPIIPVLSLRLSWQQKLAVVGLFASGTLVVIASIVVIVESAKYDSSSPESNIAIAPSALWGGAEANLAVFCSCLPMLRPIFRKIIPTRSRSGSSATGAIDAVRLSNIVLPGGDLESGTARRGSRLKPSISWAKKERRPSTAQVQMRLHDDTWQLKRNDRSRGSVKEASTSEIRRMNSDESSHAERVECGV